MENRNGTGTPPAGFPFGVDEVAQRALEKREDEDKRIDERADKRIELHLNTCPAALLRLKFAGASAVVVVLLGSAIVGVGFWIRSTLLSTMAVNQAETLAKVTDLIRKEMDYRLDHLTMLRPTQAAPSLTGRLP